MVDVPEGIEHIAKHLKNAGLKASGDLCLPPPCAWVSPAGLTPINLCGSYTMRADVVLIATCLDKAHEELTVLLTRALTVFPPTAEIDLAATIYHPLAEGELPAYRLPIEVTLSDC